jgi:hypothetical protein
LLANKTKKKLGEGEGESMKICTRVGLQLVFSEAERILEVRRQQLNPESLDSLLFFEKF